MLNRVQIEGFIEEAPMVKALPDGDTIAVWILRHERKSRSGLVMFNTFKCVAWGKLREAAADLEKGDFVRVQGAGQSYRDAENGALGFQIAATGIQQREAPEPLGADDGVAVVDYR